VLPNIIRYVQVIVWIVMKIKYFPAGNTVQVVVGCQGSNFSEQCLSAGFLAVSFDCEFIEQGILLEQLDNFGL